MMPTETLEGGGAQQINSLSQGQAFDDVDKQGYEDDGGQDYRGGPGGLRQHITQQALRGPGGAGQPEVLNMTPKDVADTEE